MGGKEGERVSGRRREGRVGEWEEKKWVGGRRGGWMGESGGGVGGLKGGRVGWVERRKRCVGWKGEGGQRLEGRGEDEGW